MSRSSCAPVGAQAQGGLAFGNKNKGFFVLLSLNRNSDIRRKYSRSGIKIK